MYIVMDPSMGVSHGRLDGPVPFFHPFEYFIFDYGIVYLFVTQQTIIIIKEYYCTPG
jgi:hypothetical protein